MALLQAALPESFRIQQSLVFGYIRRCESSHTVILPAVIHSLCVSYYYIKEYFKQIGNNILSNNDSMISSYIRIPDKAHGAVIISNECDMIHQWIFKIARCPVYGGCNGWGGIIIGLTEVNSIDYGYTNIKFYGYRDDGKKITNQCGKWMNEHLQEFGLPFVTGNVIKMEYNTSSNILSFGHNEESFVLRKAFDNLLSPIQYRMTVSIYGSGFCTTSVHLIKYTSKKLFTFHS